MNVIKPLYIGQMFILMLPVFTLVLLDDAT